MQLAYDTDSLFIGGRWSVETGRPTATWLSPSTEENYGRSARPTRADADAAVAAARGAFRVGTWRRLTVRDRASLLRRAAAIIRPQVAGIAMTSAYEIGAPLGVTTMFAQVVLTVIDRMGELAASVPDVDTGTGLWEFEIEHEPAGVVLDIVPWNSPFSAVVMKSAQALLAGCSVISKPPPSAPFAVRAWADALNEAGLPEGVYSLLPADADVSEYLVAHPGVDLVVFTGGTPVGRRVAELCGRNLKRVLLELGGKSAAIVLDDSDLQGAVDAVASGVYYNSGQICSALTRMLVPRAAVDDVVERLRGKASALVLGSPFAPETMMGPLASRSHQQRVLSLIAEGEKDGAQLVFGGRRPASQPRGWFVEPTLFVSSNDTSVAREEVFGPVVTVIAHDGDDNAVEIANDSAYGLGGSVFAADQARAREVASRLDTGSVTINGYTTNLLASRDPHKWSGSGSVTGVAGFQSFRSSRLVNLRAAAGAWAPATLFARAD
jgi:acyl-CoA reductase-like NAD-dependent aldehyde dehydrogenase